MPTRRGRLEPRRLRRSPAPAERGPPLGDTFTPRQFTDALFDPANAPTPTFPPSPPGFEPATSGSSAEDVLGSFGVDASHLPSLRRKLADLPAKTGVYRWLAGDGTVLYIGKAKSLRDRTRGYLAPGLLRRSPRHRRLAGLARSVDTVLTPGGEADALALEARLIAGTKPPLNVLLKEAPKPDAALVVGLMGDPVGDDDVLPRFFMTDAGGRSRSGGRFSGGARRESAAGAGTRATTRTPARGRVVPGSGTTASAGA